MSDFLLKVRRGESPFYQVLKKTAQVVINANLPVPGFLHPFLRFLYSFSFGALDLFQGTITFLYREPLFRARCASAGPHLKVNRLPEIFGHTQIHLGEGVCFSGKVGMASGRFLDKPTLIIKDRSIIGHNVLFSVNQEIIIEEDVMIANNCSITDNDGHPRAMDLRIQHASLTAQDMRPVRICRGAWLGRGVQVMKGVTIGEGAIISADSIVVSDVPPYALAMGNPAVVVMRGAGKPKAGGATPVEALPKAQEKTPVNNSTAGSTQVNSIESRNISDGQLPITRATVLQEIRTVLTRFDESQAAIPFEDLGLDSFDMVTLRSLLEQKLSRTIPTQVWLQLETVNDIIKYYIDESRSQGTVTRQAIPDGARMSRQLKINMPQMAIGGLSEPWLFKELGDVHWQGICDGLGTESHAISDDADNRLYATFVRFRWEGTDHLKAFRENEPIQIVSRLSRYGKSMFLSDTEIEGTGKSIRASLMTAFASRQGSNESLMKGEPVIPVNCPVADQKTMPTFLKEYRQFRKRERQDVELSGETLSVAADVVDQIEYTITPYHDLNGVNLLYFATYPTIADICEREFVHRHRERLGVKTDWAMESSTIARDIFYFGNCDINEKLLFRIHMFEAEKGGKAALAATLSRKSDEQLLCYTFTVKQWHG